MHTTIKAENKKCASTATRDRVDVHYCDASQNNDTNHNSYKGRMLCFIRQFAAFFIHFVFFFHNNERQHKIERYT